MFSGFFNLGHFTSLRMIDSLLHRVTRPALAERELFGFLHKGLATWFKRRFKHFTPAQLLTLPEIARGESVLLSSPTGSGKTLAAFLGVFDCLAKMHEPGRLSHGIFSVYLSPLRPPPYQLPKNPPRPP